jgi:uncharacterized protein (UPF0332 family)
MSPLPAETQALLVKAGDNIRAAQVLRREKLNEIAAYGREFAKTAQLDPRFHRYLIDAQDLRHSGDYETGVIVSPDEVDAAIWWAQEFLAAAEGFLRPAP